MGKRFSGNFFLVVFVLAFSIQPSSVFANINTIATQRLTYQEAAEYFGENVSAIGDVNADGNQDIAVSGSYNNVAAANAGAIYVYFGNGGGVNATPDLTIRGETAGDYLGYGNKTISSAGDINGDGYQDFMVASDYYNNRQGRVYIFHGGPSLNDTADVVITGPTAAVTYFGSTINNIGDINHDGYSDIIIGQEGSTNGNAYIYYGGSSMDTTADVTFTGEAAGDALGSFVGLAGDVNNDGNQDILIGAYLNDTAGTNAGAAYIFYGNGSGVDTTADVTMRAAAANDLLGYYATTLGDVNGDGYADVLVTAYGQDTGGSNVGAAYVYYGGSSMDGTADVTFRGSASEEYFGGSTGYVGDINGDGYNDIMVGTSNYSSNKGRLSIYYGGSSIDSIADVTLTGENNNDYLSSWWVGGASAVDINHDNAVDILVGAPGYSGGAYNGAAYIFLGIPPTSSNSSSDEGNGSSESSTTPTIANSQQQGTQRIITTNTTTSPTITVKPVDIDQVEKVTFRINGKVYTMKPTNTSNYTLKLPKIPKPGKYPYSVTAYYSNTTSTTPGTIIVKDNKGSSSSNTLLTQINSVFRTVYNQNPTTEQWKYWQTRIVNKEKTTLDQLLGAMQWQRVQGN